MIQFLTSFGFVKILIELYIRTLIADRPCFEGGPSSEESSLHGSMQN